MTAVCVCPAHKCAALRASGTLNPRPERVRAPLFHVNPFFDAHDLVQVKYEMLRLVDQDGVCVQQAARMFGFSRTAWYQIKLKYVAAGMLGLLPQRRGPQRLKKSLLVIMAAPKPKPKPNRHMSDCVNRPLAQTA